MCRSWSAALTSRVDGKCFEGAKHCYCGVRCYQMHSVFVENLMERLRLVDGSCCSMYARREKLKADAKPLLSGESEV